MNGLILTTSGAAEIEAAYQNGQTVTVRHVLLGDGGGRALPSTPDEMAAMTSLYGEFGQEPFSDGAVEEGFISGDIVIDCKSYPGKTLRELGMISDRGTLIAYGRYPDTFLPDQTDSVIKEVILTLVLGLTHAQNVVLEVDPDRAIITQEIGDRRYLQRKKNLSDVEDKDEAVENLGLKPTVDKAKNAVQRDGDTMTGELKIRGVNALRIFNEAFGLIFRRSEECLHLIPTSEGQGENGDIGPLRPFTINLRTGEISMSHKVSVGGGSQVNGALGIGVQNALGGNSIAFGDNDTGIKQNGDGILDVYANGQHVFRFQNGVAIALKNIQAGNAKKFTLSSVNNSTKNATFNLWGNSSRPVVAELGDDSGWHFYSQRNTDGSITFAVNGQMTPSNYGNFDARYQQRNGGVQDVRYGSEMYYNPGGNQVSWTFRSPSGHGLTGINVQETGSNSADNIGGVYYRPLQKLINGTWYNVASV
ncbi:TPA: phage tail protein [Escherichia coli]|uniref:phage tail-collar fiber domain-containing protein n=2 Tax=Escherichia coli TaxID=562 RepID=UPI0017F9CBD3|nr:phage tail protein [Escherichia coli]EFC9335639.1 phage tail protein [Escherichia coli]EFD0059659.1 phage tail protein [Escherichia coli]EFD0084584.1 phage tail protein [Escherichia coli]EJW9337390.1 phage tail protein [Escherichia coli]HAJ5472290.1 phage tail protein [Escherichia coli]